MDSVRDKAKKFLDQLPDNVNVTSNGTYGALFTTLTGMSHEGLQKTWATEDIPKAERRKKGESTAGLATTTSCNGFTGKLSNAVNAPIYLGRFDLAAELKKQGVSDAWIPATSGKKPGCGDVFKMKKFHVGVSIDFTGDVWNTAEGGQGGPGQDYTQGFDIVKRKHQTWDPSTLEGWVDIEVLARIAVKAPKWMIGWWRFEIGAAREFVFVPEKGVARAFPTAPAALTPVSEGGRTGALEVEPGGNRVAITWTDEKIGQDRLGPLPGVPYMLGERGSAQVQAFRLK
ncbi:hypothetical protein [Zavarzinia compransoris]|uniref:Uncharacterized protein n=1 Tax=Zavarzinia compransoris TaxID=1264899 RepID=A0A317E5Q5_9PROT|nr:hypothetical protein [Zavarzinia compransoris]PWR21942.1 hypothetical protein DKG75_08155 [Zavarzinia compransoris]TDP47321.1 hypothetical protein DES42_103493 [Zavarzinia compransoris]